MEPAIEWFDEFVARHIERFPRPDWPEADSGFWTGIVRLFVRHRVTLELADYASQALMEGPPQYLDRHPAELIERIRAAQRELAASKPAVRHGDMRDPNVHHDRLAQQLWDHQDEQTKEEWRELVRKGMPFLARYPPVVEKLAMGWCYDPLMVVKPYDGPKEPTTGPRNPFR